MKIVLLEPFLSGSHASWAREYARYSRHDVKVLGLPGRHWKWRMHGGAVSLAGMFRAGNHRPDLLLASDMLDLTTFLALTRDLTAGLPTAIYFHENQLTYPWSPTDPDPLRHRDHHYGFINYTSALAADAVYFNSDFHREAFLAALPGFLEAFPDHRETATVELLAAKSRTLSLGLDLRAFDAYRDGKENRKPLFLWNHRWEYDKNPDEFFRALFTLFEQGLDFEIAVLGESYRRNPGIFSEARRKLADRIRCWGYVPDFADYAKWLWRADVLPVTSRHDFFGVSVMQAVYCGVFPLLPERLAYPEHFPGNGYPENYYNDFDDLVMKLGELCRSRRDLQTKTLQQRAACYDWSTLGPIYDHEFELLASGFC